MCGRASGRYAEGYKCWSPQDVRRYWRLTRVKLEFRVTGKLEFRVKLQWWPSLAKDLVHNLPVVAALLADTVLEKEQDAFTPKFDAEGKPFPISIPWAKLLCQDLLNLALFFSDDAAIFRAKWGMSLIQVVEEAEANKAAALEAKKKKQEEPNPSQALAHACGPHCHIAVSTAST